MSNLPCSENTKKGAEDICVKTCTTSEKCWIERPKYFNGQLLTDADLRTEQNYFIEKNKLHNRYLHGWGVVCGLKVKCYPCCSGHGSSGKVIVEPGYALDCCGNDIVICNKQEFDVIKRINEIKKKKKEESDPCAPAAAPTPAPCPDKEEKYYLTIAYKEEDAKPATALKAKDGCSIQKCVPSRTKECFEFDLIPYCSLTKKGEGLFAKLGKCSEKFGQALAQTPPSGTENNKLAWTAQDFKNLTRDYYKSLGDNFRCSLLDELDEIDIPDNVNLLLSDLTLARDAEKYKEDAYRLISLPIYLLLDCWCSALLNPCPECDEDDVVILATLVLKNNKIERICNFSRKFLVTQLSLNYWISPFINTVVASLSKLFERYGCSKVNSLPDLMKCLCCEFEIFKKGSLPPVAYILKLIEGDLKLPKIFHQNLTSSIFAVSQGLFESADPANVSLEGALNKKSSESTATLKELNIDVMGAEIYEPSLKDLSLEHIISTVPYAKPGSKVIQLVDKEDNVVGFRTVKVEKAPPEIEVAELRKEIDNIKASISVMRRDAGSTIKTKIPIKEEYRNTTIDLTLSLLKEMKLEDVKGMERASADKMRKAKIDNPLDVLDAAPANVSDAVGEPMSNAFKYINNAEDLSLNVAKFVAEELEKANITKKEDLNKLDIKGIAAKLNIPEKKVKAAIGRIK